MAATLSTGDDVLSPETSAFYRRAIQALAAAEVPFLVGGAYALAHYTGIVRHTKDFDFFVLPQDARRILDLLAGLGYRTELTFPHWLGKAYHGDDFCDIIFSSGNGFCVVDESWLEYAEPAEILGESVRLVPAVEMIWSKGYVIERERYDGADICHILRSYGDRLDWRRLLARFGPHWRVLLSHLVLFGFVYPGESAKVPAWVMEELMDRLGAEVQTPPPDEHLCQGTLLSRAQYLKDIETWGYHDARLGPEGTMSSKDVRRWTAPVKNGQL
ncbi:MAG TPA: hypothetical protein VEL76_07170 [Gemmataceae bacterium]|nr:hypothetical protein [Gemmataceae bacterium]